MVNYNIYFVIYNTKMSCSKGNIKRTRPQKHQNKSVFKNNLHDTSKKTKILNNLEVTGVCERCKEIIEWKIKYKKYKSLTAPRKCLSCEQKSIKHAYHIFCSKCATERKICAKCCKSFDVIVNKIETNEINNDKWQSILKNLPERKRRTFLRYMKKQQNGEEISNFNIDTILSEIDKISLGDDIHDCSSDENLSESEIQ